MNSIDDWDDPRDQQGFDEDELGDDTSETVPCPECGVEIYEESEQCPVCGSYITHRHSVWHGKPTWWILLGALGIAVSPILRAADTTESQNPPLDQPSWFGRKRVHLHNCEAFVWQEDVNR
jgi:hypothetical protein